MMHGRQAYLRKVSFNGIQQAIRKDSEFRVAKEKKRNTHLEKLHQQNYDWNDNSRMIQNHRKTVELAERPKRLHRNL